MAKQYSVGSGKYEGETIEQLALMDYPFFLDRRDYLYKGTREGITRLWPEINAMDKLSGLLNKFLKEKKCKTSGCDSLADGIWVPSVIAYNPHTEKNFTDYNFPLYELRCEDHRLVGKFERFPLDFASTKMFSTQADVDRMQKILLTLVGFYENNPKRGKTEKEALAFFDYLRSNRQLELF